MSVDHSLTKIDEHTLKKKQLNYITCLFLKTKADPTVWIERIWWQRWIRYIVFPVMYNTHTRNYVYSITYHKTYVKLNILILAIQCDIRKDFAFLQVTPKCSYTLAMRKNHRDWAVDGRLFLYENGTFWKSTQQRNSIDRVDGSTHWSFVFPALTHRSEGASKIFPITENPFR